MMNSASRRLIRIVALAALMATVGQSARASLFVVPKSALQPPQVTFSEVASGTSLNGLTINGFKFSESTPNASTAPPGSGPGNTNNINNDMALSGGTLPVGYVLTVGLPGLSSSFGFGYAILGGDTLNIQLFNGLTSLGSLTYTGTPDPSFNGGFAGIGSTTSFTSAKITFVGPPVAFALDNFAAVPAASVPEPSTIASAVLGLVGVVALRRRRRASR